MKIMKNAVGIITALFLALPAYGTSDQGIHGEAVKLEYHNRIAKVNQRQYDAILSARAANIQTLTQCNLRVEPIADQRQNKKTLGMTLSRPLLIEGVNEWLADVKARHIDYLLEGTQTESTEPLHLRPALTRLYTYSEGMNIYGVSAIRMDLYKGHELVASKSYRGFGTKANMRGAVSEYHEVANRSIDDLFEEFFEDLPNLCESASTQSI